MIKHNNIHTLYSLLLLLQFLERIENRILLKASKYGFFNNALFIYLDKATYSNMIYDVLGCFNLEGLIILT